MDVDGSFIRSCENFLDYPKNLVQHDAFSHYLQAYHERLAYHSNRLFNEKPDQAAVDFLDLNEGATNFSPTCAANLQDLKLLLREALVPGRNDPQCRFIFLHAPHSRAALRVSHSMLTFLFSYHQVIPSFLDFLSPFGKQVYARDFYFSGLREESRLDNRRKGTNIAGLNRSGNDLRLCYNLRSVEQSKEQPGLPWSIRQSAIYHEFDVISGRALWIVVKGNKLIKTRIEEASTLPSLTNMRTRSEAFSASLAPHLLLCDWAGENWRWYIDDLIESSTTPSHNRTLASGSGLRRPANTFSSNTGEGAVTGLNNMKNEREREALTISDLQRIHYIEEKALEALLILKSNMEVLNELKQYYIYATKHTDFPTELRTDCEADLARFDWCILSVGKDLRMLQSRIDTLIHLLGNRKNLLNGILQYRSSKAMTVLTQDMHEIAQETKRETVSMRIITSVTLFFLPATFMATFMSTDILTFDNGVNDFQLSGLKLYLAVALPLTALTFLAWYVMYRLAGKRRMADKRGDGADAV